MVTHTALALAVVLSCVISVGVTLAIGHLYMAGKNDHICDHLKICWNILGKYRQVMPQEAQPLDAAMGHLHMAMMQLGASKPNAQEPSQDPGPVTELKDPDLEDR
jgi:hypothetical protein